MPNPLSTFHRSPSYSHSAPGYYHPLRENDGLARMALECIDGWAHVENTMMLIYMHLAGGGRTDAATVFQAIESDSARRSAISALVASKLDEDHQRLFRAVTRCLTSRQKERNRLAHWTWGYSRDVPDGLLLGDPIAMAAKAPGDEDADALETFDKWMLDHILVYKEADFERILSGMAQAAVYAHGLLVIVKRHPNMKGSEQWQKLSEAPEVAGILQRLQASDHQIPPGDQFLGHNT